MKIRFGPLSTGLYIWLSTIGRYLGEPNDEGTPAPEAGHRINPIN